MPDSNIIQFVPKANPNRTTQELREIGLRIIASKEFQDEMALSPKEPHPYDPVAVAIMRGYYDEYLPKG